MVSENVDDASDGLMARWLKSFLTHRPLMFRLVGRIVRPDEIEDIVQETFLLTYRAARKQKIDNPRAFMLKTAKNIALNHIARAERKLNCSIEDLSSAEIGTSIGSVEAHYQSEERFLVFCRAVAELPVGCRRVFILKKVYGLSQAEIANYLKLSPSTVEKHVARGMLLTAQYMSRSGHAVGAADNEEVHFYPDEAKNKVE
jgi:RNA polymerase sigma factor (sigma-70 family)